MFPRDSVHVYDRNHAVNIIGWTHLRQWFLHQPVLRKQLFQGSDHVSRHSMTLYGNLDNNARTPLINTSLFGFVAKMSRRISYAGHTGRAYPVVTDNFTPFHQTGLPLRSWLLLKMHGVILMDHSKMRTSSSTPSKYFGTTLRVRWKCNMRITDAAGSDPGHQNLAMECTAWVFCYQPFQPKISSVSCSLPHDFSQCLSPAPWFGACIRFLSFIPAIFYPWNSRHL